VTSRREERPRGSGRSRTSRPSGDAIGDAATVAAAGDLSRDAARRLRGGRLPHVAPPAAPVGTVLDLELEAPGDSRPEVILRDERREATWRVALEPVRQDRWTARVMLPHEPTVVRYHFLLADGSLVRERRQVEGVVEPVYGEWEERDFRIAAYRPSAAPPAWVGGTVVYQIVPDRFAVGDPERPGRRDGDVNGREPLHLAWGERPEVPPKGRDFFGGDLAGIISRLDYLRDLGVSCIYLTPIFAARTNHRYDATDYFLIDPMLGTLDDFRRLVRDAGDRGIRILLDGVFNHCSRDSRYFREARRDRSSPYYRWFEFQEWPDTYTGWADVATLPEFVECPETEEFFLGPDGVARHWLAEGIAGWRTDVTPWITDAWWRRFRHAVRPDGGDGPYLVAEDWADVTGRLVGDQFDGAMNYRFAYTVTGFATGRLTPSELDDRLEMLRRDTPEPMFHAQMNLLGSHDTARLLTVCGGDRARVRLAAAVQLAYPGTPMICYGDEAGIEGEFAEDGRRSFPWDGPDHELTTFYAAAAGARRSSVTLRQGDVRTVWIDDATSSYGFLRTGDDGPVAALFNAGERPAAIAAPVGAWGSGRWTDMLGGLEAVVVEGDVLRVTLPPLASAWFRPT
jgi:cyclomaltodextrinase / maltogenic alpha-amylase / neopullulanase